MVNQLEPFLDRWRSSKNRKHDLDILIDRAIPTAMLYERVVWLIDFLQWVRYSKNYRDSADVSTIRVPGARIKFFIKLLERNIDVKRRVAKTMRSVIRDMSSSDLFAEVGLPKEQSFWAEFSDRVFRKVMPEPAVTSGMASLFSALFASPTDSEWIKALEPEVIQKVVDLLNFESNADPEGWNTLQKQMEQGLLLLATDIQAAGLSSPVRKRTGVDDIADVPFVALIHDVEKFVESQNQGGGAKAAAAQAVYERIKKCRDVIADVYHHLDTFGVSSKVVYTLELLHSKMRRLEELVSFLSLEGNDPATIQGFIVRLIQENQDRQSLSALFLHNSKMLARKIVDRSAETGEHYIARSDDEYRHMKRAAAGGGAITSATVYIKMILSAAKLSPFFFGLFASINYAISFSLIQYFGFTLATKQPAMTGPALAARMDNIETESDLKKIVDEIISLIQTQSIGIIGNVGVVIPAVIVVEVLVEILFRRHFLLADRAEYVFHSTSVLGFTPIYAAFTGILLWVSSLCAGWVDNWIVLNRFDTNIRFNRRLMFVFGAERCDRWAAYIKKYAPSFTANVSLGFLLGLTPAIFQFFGLNLEVRHVTLQSGAFAAGVMYFGLQSFKMPTFYLAILGLISIGALNVAVSFALAFFTAVRSRDINAPQRRLIYRALFERFRHDPVGFFFRHLAHNR